MSLGLITPTFLLSLFVGILMLQQRGERLKMPWATIAILVVTLSVGSFVAFDDRLLDALRADGVQLAAGEWWRLITPLVATEGGLPGLLIGLVLLAIVGTIAENLFGPWAVLGVYVGAGLAGVTLGSLVLTESYVGGSVAAFGLVGLVLVASAWGNFVTRVIGVIGFVLGIVLLVTFDLHGVGFMVGALVGAVIQAVRMLKARPRMSARSAAPGSPGESSAGS